MFCTCSKLIIINFYSLLLEKMIFYNASRIIKFQSACILMESSFVHTLSFLHFDRLVEGVVIIILID